MGKIQMQLYENGLDKVRRLERALRAVTEDGVPVTAACAKENLQYEWFRRFVSQDIDADRAQRAKERAEQLIEKAKDQRELELAQARLKRALTRLQVTAK